MMPECCNVEVQTVVLKTTEAALGLMIPRADWRCYDEREGVGSNGKRFPKLYRTAEHKFDRSTAGSVLSAFLSLVSRKLSFTHAQNL